MNVPPVIHRPPPPSRRHLWWWALALIPLLVGIYMVVSLFSFFRLGRDARALRNAALEAAPAGSALRMEFAVGPGTLALARFGTSFLDLDEDARSALEFVRGAEVGIYRFETGGARSHRASILNRTDRAMSARGWERMVGVSHADKVVAVYVPEDLGKRGRLRVCVLTLTESEMVIAGASGRAEPLLKLAQRHLPVQPSLALSASP